MVCSSQDAYLAMEWELTRGECQLQLKFKMEGGESGQDPYPMPTACGGPALPEGHRAERQWQHQRPEPGEVPEGARPGHGHVLWQSWCPRGPWGGWPTTTRVIWSLVDDCLEGLKQFLMSHNCWESRSPVMGVGGPPSVGLVGLASAFAFEFNFAWTRQLTSTATDQDLSAAKTCSVC